MSSLKVSVWGEQIPLENIFRDLINAAAETSTLKELAKTLVLLKYCEKLNIQTATDEQTKETIFQEFCKAFNLHSEDKVEAFLKQSKQSKEAVIAKLLFRKKVEDLKKQLCSSEKVNEFFLLNKSKRFDTFEFAVIRVKEEGMAWEVYHRIKDDKENFETLARECSIGPEAATGGLTQPQPASSLHPEVAKRLSNLKPSEICEPFAIDPNSFFILKLLQVRNAQFTPQIERSLREDMFQQWIEKEIGGAAIELVQGD